MKKLLISFFVSLCFFSLAFSFDFGLNIQNYTSFLKQDESQTFVQSNTASLWASQRAETYEAAGSGSYTFNYVKTVDTNLIDRGIFDLDYLYYTRFLSFEDQVVDTLDVQVGRFFTNNVNTYVFNSKLDGLKAEASLNNLSFGAQILYTGLLLNKTSPIKMSVGDSENTDNFGSKRIIYSAYALFDEFVSRQNAHFEFVGQNDLNAYEDDSLDSYYLSLGLNGSIIPSLDYDLVSVYGIANVYNTIESYVLVDANLRLAIPTIKGQLSLEGLFPFALHDSGGSFKAITEKPLSFVETAITATSLQSLTLTANMSLSSTVLLSAKFHNYFSQSPNAFSFVDPTKEGRYVGSELVFNCSLIPTSDFSLGLTGGIMLFNKDLVEDTSLNPFKVSLTASLFI